MYVKTLRRREVKDDCFALQDGRCVALTTMSCENCNFYKTKEQVKEVTDRCKARCKKLGYLYGQDYVNAHSNQIIKGEKL